MYIRHRQSGCILPATDFAPFEQAVNMDNEQNATHQKYALAWTPDRFTFTGLTLLILLCSM